MEASKIPTSIDQKKPKKKSPASQPVEPIQALLAGPAPPVHSNAGSTPPPRPLDGSRSCSSDSAIRLPDRVACAWIYCPIDKIHRHRAMGETRRGSKPPLEKPPVRRRHRRSTTKKGEVKGCPRSERRDRERERERERG